MGNTLFTPYSIKMPLDEMADNLELECVFSLEQICSIVDIGQNMGVIDDDDYDIDEEEENQNFLSETLGIIDSRAKWCVDKYPFCADQQSLYVKENCNDIIQSVYIFLLLATREKMNTQRIADGIDGALLFERLSAQILHNYFGKHSHTSVFGTGSGISESFKEKLQRFLREIGERGYQIIENNIDPSKKDGGIDLFVHIPFEDKKKGQFIGLGQCKTGTSWNMVLGMMRPETLATYITPSLVFTPISIYMLTDTIPLRKWEDISRQSGGFVFDRCRMMNWLPMNLDAQILSDIKKWNKAVIKRHQ